MNRILFFSLIFSCISCKTYLDNENLKPFVDDELRFESFHDYNLFEVKHRVPASADQQVYYPRKFKISLPKNIEDWRIINNTYLFKYSNSQYLIIQAGFVDDDKQETWDFKSFDSSFKKHDLYLIMEDFGLSENYIVKKLKSKSSNRLTKLYTNSDVNIILFNIKKENFNEFLKNVKTFEYRN